MNEVQKIQIFLDKNPEVHNAVNKFKDEFTFCEMAYKELLKSYLESKDKIYQEENLKLNLNQISAVLKFHKINISKDLLNSLFSMQNKYTKRNTKSAKALRNAVTHKMTIQDLNEIYSRNDELLSKMKEVLNALNKPNSA